MREKLSDVVARGKTLDPFVAMVAQHQGVKVVLHDSARPFHNAKVNLELRGVSVLHAFEVGLTAHRLGKEMCFTEGGELSMCLTKGNTLDFIGVSAKAPCPACELDEGKRSNEQRSKK